MNAVAGGRDDARQGGEKAETMTPSLQAAKMAVQKTARVITLCVSGEAEKVAAVALSTLALIILSGCRGED